MTTTLPTRPASASADPAPAAARAARGRLPGSPRVAATVRRWLFFAVVLVAALLWLFPLLLVVATSLRTAGYPTVDLLRWLEGFTLANFADAWVRADMANYLVNSSIIAVIKVPLGILISAMCAFGLARFRFRFRSPLIVVIIAGAAIPLQIPLIALFRLLLDIGILDTYQGLILCYIALGIPYQVLFLMASFNRIPIELEEAAKLDGLGPWRYWWRIVMPLSVPVIASLVILDFVSTWNEFPIAITVLQTQENWTVPLGLLSFMGPFSNDYQLLTAATLIGSAPVMIVYIALQRYFVSGLTAGAIKG
jgi:raffinose/stachyose/melibiose transport system permease protein